jgi:hypothetical protein
MYQIYKKWQGRHKKQCTKVRPQQAPPEGGFEKLDFTQNSYPQWGQLIPFSKNSTSTTKK